MKPCHLGAYSLTISLTINVLLHNGSYKDCTTNSAWSMGEYSISGEDGKCFFVVVFLVNNETKSTIIHIIIIKSVREYERTFNTNGLTAKID